MNVTIAASVFCNWQLASPSLQHIGNQKPLAVIDLAKEADFLQIAEYLAQADNRALLIFSPLELALEQAASLQIEPSQAVALWQFNANQLVRFCKQQRSKLLLFNLADILAAPQLCATLCAQQWSDSSINTAPLAATSHSAPTLYRLLAQNLLSNTPELLTLSQQLVALAQPAPVSSALSVTHNEINQLVADHNTGMQAVAQLAEIKQENQLLLEQLHLVQETLETKLVEHSAQVTSIKQQLATQSTALTKEQTTLRQQAAELTKEQATAKLATTAANEAQQENTLLLEQLHIVQEELEKHFLAQQRQLQPPTETQAEFALAIELPASRVTAAKSSPLKRQLNKRAAKKRLKHQAAEIAGSALFDSSWYLNRYPDVANNSDFSNNPALHYLKFGGFEGRNPSADFDSQAYLDANTDVAMAGTNPLYHYLRFGKAEQRPLY